MIVTELQNVRIFRVQPDDWDDELIMVLDEGEPRFYAAIDLKYSYFEKALERESSSITGEGEGGSE